MLTRARYLRAGRTAKMLTRRGTGYPVHQGDAANAPRIVRASTDPFRPAAIRKSEAFISRDGSLPPGFAWYVLVGETVAPQSIPETACAIEIPHTFDYIGDG